MTPTQADAVDELAIMAGEGSSQRNSTALAICYSQLNPWTCCSLGGGPAQQSMLALLVEIGTPVQPPKPRGKSPGWTEGNTRTKPPRYPTVKKRVARPKKSPKVAA